MLVPLLRVSTLLSNNQLFKILTTEIRTFLLECNPLSRASLWAPRPWGLLQPQVLKERKVWVTLHQWNKNFRLPMWIWVVPINHSWYQVTNPKVKIEKSPIIITRIIVKWWSQNLLFLRKVGDLSETHLDLN